MPLRYRVGLILIIIFALSGVGNYAIQQFIVNPNFKSLERDEAKEHLESCVEAVKREVHHLSSLCRDWSSWDDTYDFVESRSEDYIRSNLLAATFSDNELNLLYIVDMDGRVVWGQIYDLETEERGELPGFPGDALQKTHRLLPSPEGERTLPDTVISGVFMTEMGPMLVASRPILTSNSEGPARGFLMMGRFLNDKIVETLADQTGVDFTVSPARDKPIAQAVAEAPARFVDGLPYLIGEEDSDRLLAYTVYPDIEGRPALLISERMPRNITAKGRVAMNYASISILILAFVILVVILLFLQGIVLRPIKDLTNHVLSIRKTGNLSKRLFVERRDEIGILMRELNGVFEQLERQSSELIKVNKELRDDIAKRREAERALLESEEKLNRSKRMEALGLLAGGVAHDLNNMLSGVVSYPDLLLMDDELSPKYRKALKVIQASGRKAAMVVADLLTVARGVATRKEIISINDIVKEYMLSPEYERLLQYHPALTINVSFDADLLYVRGSPVHITKVVMNLVSNAAEAMGNDGGIITISTVNRYLDRPVKGYDEVNTGEYAVLSVSDQGQGISQEDLGRIFEPFYTKKVLGRSGTGLGLAVVWNTVQDHNGYIDVETSEVGTTFRVYFPITRVRMVEERPESTIENLRGNGQKILVVDDEESQRSIARDILAMLGYNVEAVPSGEMAIEYLKEQRVDLILLDMIMDPGMNGRQTYEMIIEINPSQKAIISSGFSETEEVRKAQQLGAGQYIKKPYSFQGIARVVKDELER
jgi:sensor domain CHASE-containing protein/nitrogen-specific signal transduction histidine kinase